MGFSATVFISIASVEATQSFVLSLPKVVATVVFIYVCIGRRARALAAQKASMPVLPSMNDPRAIHKFFLEQIQQGENALSTGCIDEAVQHFAYAVVVCGQPTQLLQVLQQSLSPGVFSKLVASLPEVRKVVTCY